MEAEESAATVVKMTKDEIEAEITKAMLARLDDFKQQADNLTLEGVRRALEEDLGMERLSLDAYKKFIKQCLEKYFYGDDSKNASETEGKAAEELVPPVKKEDLQPEEDLRDSSFGPNKNLKGSPGVGGHEQADHEIEKSCNSSEHGSEINEDTIKKAIRKRAPYFRSNLEITLGKVRRLLEEDLKLEKNSLDAFKKFISNELDAILQSDEAVQATNGVKKEPKKTSKKRSMGKASKGAKKPSKDSDSSNSDDVSSEDEDKEIRKPKKRPAPKDKEDTKGLKRRKVSATQRSKASASGKKKSAEADSGKSDESDGGKLSEDDRSQSSGEEEEVKKKNEKPAQIYGKRVENLKSIIKSCGMSIPPSVYKRVKQAPESKREAHLIKELEEILEREGLSTNPSEKEIKAVKKRKERAKELEGIDMSNIVSSSRRRSAFSYTPPPKPKIEAESDEDGEEDEDDDNEEDSDEGDNEDSSEGSDGDDAEEESD